MRYVFSQQQVFHLMGLTSVASKDLSRPTLNSIEFTFRGKELTAVATDSYRLGIYTFEVDTVSKGEVTFALNTAKFLRRVRFLFTEAKEAGIKKPEIVLEVDDLNEVRWSVNDSSAVPSLSMRTLDATFPNWKQLFGGRSWKADEYRDYTKDNGRIALKDSKLGAFNSDFLGTISKAKGLASNQQGSLRRLPTMIALGPDADKQGADTSLKPWIFACPGEGVSLVFLFMPVRF